MNRMKRKLLLPGVALVILGGGIALASQFLPIQTTYDFPLLREQIPDSSTDAQKIQDATASESGGSTTGDHGPLPAHIRIQVPFSPQAPFGNWDLPYQEACEEMSLILVHHFLEGEDITPAQADDEIKAMTEWETKHFGYYADTTIEQVKEIAELYYKHNARLVYDPTVDDIKRELAAGHPVLAPFAGRDLGNPYYSGEGPWYHMMVITGYDAANFITNDVGTKRGEGYRYRYATLMNAMHNWTGVKEDIRSGRKAILIVTD
jgi:hypothetical protein